MPKVVDKNLTDKQAIFVSEYVINGFNATKAALKAGYSPDTAYSMGPRLLKNVEIASEVKKRIEEIITPEYVKSELAGIAAVDMAEYEEILASGMSMKEMRAEGVDTRMIKRIKATRRIVGKGDNAYPVEDVTVELHDRQAAIVNLGKTLALFTDRVEQEGKFEHEHRFPGLTGDELEAIAKMKGGPK